MAGEKESVEAYLKTVDRLEPDITPIDLDAGIASIAVSLRSIGITLDLILKHLRGRMS